MLLFFTLLCLDKGTVQGGFHLNVENGSKPVDNMCDKQGGINTRVSLLCNPSANWKDQDLTGSFNIYRDPLKPCTVSFVICMDP